eukprot:SAG11_NODE_512_length_8839_cov_5.600572_2_plen_50_part_00
MDREDMWAWVVCTYSQRRGFGLGPDIAEEVGGGAVGGEVRVCTFAEEGG